MDLPCVLQLIERRELRVALQPIVHIHDGSLLAHEVLVRSTSPDFRTPREMFEAAVLSGHCGRLGRAIREIAVQTAPTFALFLNVHPNELHDGLLAEDDDPIYRHPRDVFLEITESVPLSHFQLCQEVLRKIRERGIHLVIDDLGAGYSNLRYIADLHPRLVKLDRALVTGLSRKPRMQSLVASIVSLCENLGAEVVAEGIKTLDELLAARDAGVHYAQGYLMARPSMPPPEARWPLPSDAPGAPPSGPMPVRIPTAERQVRISHVEDLKTEPGSEADQGADDKRAAEE
ncbi:MAG: EAL domain-containing protein [Deltaproteobacteria bacterium]|nr:EAL domain-containing protein [Deltaproteobacteria bacterium]MBW2530199.1 EAL domain-containing protein [Deltaproteobacteria bacterium]